MKNTIIKFKYLSIFLLMIFFFANQDVFAQRNYYFSSTTGNDANDGSTPDKAKKSLSWLYSNYTAIQPGDSILLKRGDTFAENSVPHSAHLHIRELTGTAVNRIVVGAYGTGEKPIVSNENYQNAQALKMRGGIYFTIQDIDFIGGAWFDPHLYTGATDGLAYAKILRCSFIGITKSSYTGFLINSAFNHLVQPDGDLSENGITYSETSIGRPVHHIEIAYCKIENSLHGFNLNYIDSYLHFHHNEAYNNGGDGLDVGGGSNHIIEYNKLISSRNAGIKIHSQKVLLQNAIVRGNLVVNSLYQSATILQHIEGCKIYNNTFVDNFSAEIGNRDRWIWDPNISNYDINSKSYLTSGTYATYYGTFQNNDIFNNIFSGVIQIAGVWDDIVITDTLVGRNNYHNNLYTYVHASVSGGVDYMFMRKWDNVVSQGEWNGKSSVDPVYSVSYKLYASNFVSDWQSKTSPTEIYSTDVTSVFNDPVYTSYTDYGDYSLKTGSPAIGAGVYVPGYDYDINGNPIPAGSPSIGAFEIATEQGSNDLNLDLKIYLEGAFSSGQMTKNLNTYNYIPLTQPYNDSPWNYNGSETLSSIPTNMVDWVLVELRTGTPASSKAASRAGVLLTSGKVVDVDGSSPVSFSDLSGGNYYVVVKHRNHLAVMTPSALLLSSAITSYDFTNQLSKAYGFNPMKLKDGYYCLYAGDGDANGGINSTDANLVWKVENGTIGYKSGDFDLNSGVNATDRNSIWKINNGLITQVPN